jgi:hypothetical protein
MSRSESDGGRRARVLLSPDSGSAPIGRTLMLLTSTSTATIDADTSASRRVSERVPVTGPRYRGSSKGGATSVAAALVLPAKSSTEPRFGLTFRAVPERHSRARCCLGEVSVMSGATGPAPRSVPVAAEQSERP